MEGAVGLGLDSGRRVLVLALTPTAGEELGKQG